MKELSVLSFTNPFGGNTENTTLALSKISTVCTHGILEIAQNLESEIRFGFTFTTSELYGHGSHPTTLSLIVTIYDFTYLSRYTWSALWVR